MYKKTLTEKNLFPRVVGTNNVLIYYPEHNKNHYIYHKKIIKKDLCEKKL